MGEVLTFPKNKMLERGDQVELAQTLIALDKVDSSGERPATDVSGTYHTFEPDSGLWRPRDPHEIKCRVDDFAGVLVEGKKEPRPLKLKASDAPAVLEIMKRHTWRPGFFRDDLIAFDNGIAVRVAKGELVAEDIRPDHGARIALPVAYRDDWTMPDDGLLAHYLRSTFPDQDDQAAAIELCGAALMGLGTRYKKAFFLTDGPDVDGRGGTGKSQLLEMLKGLVPKARWCSIPPQELAHDYHGADLYGKTLNLVFEAPDTDILREEGIKAIVHGENIRRRRIRQDPIEFTPSALHVFSVNRLPDAPGASGAFWDRWRVIEFNRRFRDTDDKIEELGKRVVREELVDLVHLALRGASRLLEHGRYTTSSTSAEALDRWRLSADPVASFIFEMCDPVDSSAPATWLSSRRLYDEYRQWCSARGHSPCSMQKFGRRIPGDVEKSRSGGVSRYRLELKSENRD